MQLKVRDFTALAYISKIHVQVRYIFTWMNYLKSLERDRKKW